MVLDYILLAVLLLASIFIVVAVTLQKSEKDGLSGTIAGGSETYYGKDKSVHTDRQLVKWTIIVGAIFIVTVLVVYFLQPEYANVTTNWWNGSKYYSAISTFFTDLFKK